MFDGPTDKLPEGCDGTVRLFPLPNLVLFPHVLQPLHIFEPRYRKMTADSLASNRQIALAVLRPGWENDYEGRPEIYPIATIGTIIADHKLEDGRYNLMLRGLARVRVVHELPAAELYREARVEAVDDRTIEDPKRAHYWATLLRKHAPAWFASNAALKEQVKHLLAGEHPLGRLADVLSFALTRDLSSKIKQLEDPCVESRLWRLFEWTGTTDAVHPVSFSVN